MSRLMPLLIILPALVAWEAASRSGLWNPLLFPPLEKIVRELALFFTRPASLLEAWTSLYRALGGFALAVAVGVPLGMVMGRSRRADQSERGQA